VIVFCVFEEVVKFVCVCGGGGDRPQASNYMTDLQPGIQRSAWSNLPSLFACLPYS